MTADAVHGESQDGIRLFLCYNKSSEIQQENSDCSYSNGEWQFMNQVIQTVLAAFSNQNIEINTARKLANLKKLDPLHLWVEKEDIVIKTECGKTPLRLYFPSEETKRQKEEISSAIFFIHGGGWSTESVETYDRICSMLSKSVDKTVISVEYRLAPEYPFPAGLEDCYLAARALY